MKPRAVFYTLLFVISLFVMSSLSFSTGLNQKLEMKLDQMIDGTAHKPFVYRQLMPSAVRVVTSLLPQEWRGGWNEWASRSSTMTRILQRVNIPSEMFVEYAVTLFLMYVSLIVFVFLFRRLFLSLYDAPVYFSDSVMLGTLAGIPAFFSYNFIYDIPTLAIFTGGLLFMLQRRWQFFILFFFLGCWSKETTILLTLVFAIHFFKVRSDGKVPYRNLLLIQCVIFTAVKSILAVIYSDNPGRFVEFHLLDNLLFGYRFTLGEFLTWIFIFIFVVYQWADKPIFLKHAFWIGIPLIVLTLFLGLLHEMRDYGELYPILFALMAHSVAVVIKIPVTVKAEI